MWKFLRIASNICNLRTQPDYQTSDRLSSEPVHSRHLARGKHSVTSARTPRQRQVADSNHISRGIRKSCKQHDIECNNQNQNQQSQPNPSFDDRP